MMDDLPHSASLRKGRWSEPGTGYLITQCRAPGLSLPLTDLMPAQAIVQSIRWHQEHQHAHLLAFVIMPDHVHWAFMLGKTRWLDQVMKGFASVTSREIIHSCALRTPVVWQQEYHDRWLRSGEMTWATLDYIHLNPARNSLCVAAEDWPWSTAAPRFRGWIEEDLLPV